MKARPRGFSLIEVMVAGALLAVGGTAVLTGYRTTMGLVEHQRRLVEGVGAATAKLEELLRLDSAAADLADNGHGPEYFDAFVRPAVPTSRTYEVSWTVSPDLPSSGYILITVDVQWTETDGRVRAQRMTAYRER